jgi:hypothetical protein
MVERSIWESATISVLPAKGGRVPHVLQVLDGIADGWPQRVALRAAILEHDEVLARVEAVPERLVVVSEDVVDRSFPQFQGGLVELPRVGVHGQPPFLLREVCGQDGVEQTRTVARHL